MVAPNAQWRCDNQDEIEALLTEFVVQTERSGDCLLIIGPLGLEVELKPGDCLLIDGDRIGVMAVPDTERPQDKPQVIEASCENCEKPVRVQISVLQDPNTVTIVCSEECRTAYEFKQRMMGGKHKLNA